MKSLKLVLVIAAIVCSATFRLEFSQAADSLNPVVSADQEPDQQHSQNSERLLPVEEKEVKETVVDADSKICVTTPTAVEAALSRWETDSHGELRYFCSSRDLFNNLGRLRI
jgi:hypothetical protein